MQQVRTLGSTICFLQIATPSKKKKSRTNGFRHLQLVQLKNKKLRVILPSQPSAFAYATARRVRGVSGLFNTNSYPSTPHSNQKVAIYILPPKNNIVNVFSQPTSLFSSNLNLNIFKHEQLRASR